MKLKRTLLTLAVMAVSVASMWADGFSTLVVRTAADEVTTVTLNDDITMSFSETTLDITDGVIEVNIPRADIASFEFTDPVGIQSIGTDGASAVVTDAAIAMSNLAAGTQVNIFDIQGRLIGQRTAAADGSLSIALDSLPRGVVMVNVNNTTLKVTLK